MNLKTTGAGRIKGGACLIFLKHHRGIEEGCLFYLKGRRGERGGNGQDTGEKKISRRKTVSGAKEDKVV